MAGSSTSTGTAATCSMRCRRCGLKAILLGDDKDFPTAFSVVNALKAHTGDMPLVVQVGFQDLVGALETHRLPGGILYKVLGVPDRDTANRVMDGVRAYRV